MPPTEQPSPPPEQNQYAFMNQSAAQASGVKFSLNDNSTKHRVLVAGGGGAILLIFFILFYTLILAHKPATGNLLTLAQQQNELITISKTALQEASQQTTKNLAINTSLSLTTSEQQLVTYLSKHKQKITAKQLALGMSATITQELSSAEAASNFDPVYIQVIQTQLDQYLQTLNQAIGTSAGVTETQLLKVELNVAKLLKSQADSTS